MEFKKILVPIDGSEPSLEALRPARRLAQTFQGQIRVATVEEFPDQPSPSEWDLTLGDFLDKKREEIERSLTRTAESLRMEGLSVSQQLLPLGPTATRILEEAESWGADLIVICSRARHGLSRLLMGSTAERVSRRSPCPVMIVHPQDHD